MGRRVLRVLGLAFTAFLAAAPVAWAQADRVAPPPVSFGVPTAPQIGAPVEIHTPDASTPAPALAISPNTGMPRLESAPGESNIGMVQLAMESTDYIDPRYVANSQHPDDLGIWESLCEGGRETTRRIIQDYRNFYLTENLLYVGVAVAVAAPIANTHADIGIRDWYQRGAGNGQSPEADETAKVFKAFGDWRYSVPIYLGLSLGQHWFPDNPTAVTLAQFGNRSLRALAVGAPTVGVLQVGLGSGRPFTGDSRWRPFDSNKAVSGHAFVGAVPFLTAASMVDNQALKALLIVGSLGPAWSRIHDDDHYFSQALLGWTIAYIAVEAVNMTECQARNVHIVPVEFPNGMGLGVQIDY